MIGWVKNWHPRTRSTPSTPTPSLWPPVFRFLFCPHMACEEKAASALVKPSSSKLGSWFEEATLLKLEVVNQDHAHICHMKTR